MIGRPGSGDLAADILSSVDQVSVGLPAEPSPRDTINGLQEAASVLGWFDGERLQTTRPVTELDRDLLIAEAVAVTDADGRRRLCLADGTRIAALRQLRERAGLEGALLANQPEAGDLIARILFGELNEFAVELTRLNLAELNATVQVRGWLAAAGFPAREIELVRRRAAWLRLLEPFELLAGEHFRGRTAELARLRAFAGVLPPGHTGTLSPSPSPARSLMVFGPGGVGKSTLVARFILEHARALEQDRFPFAYLDFDRPDVDAAEPVTLLIEALRQLCIEYPDLNHRAEQMRAGWLELLREPEGADRARMAASADLGRLVASIGASGRPVLFVLDTFEEVQWRSLEYVQLIFDVLARLSRQLPNLRVVVAGRAEIAGAAMELLPLTAMDRESAESFLSGQGVHDADAAAQIVDRVGGDPQNLKLAARDYLASRREGGGSLAGFLADLGPSVIRTKLHGRVLDHIHDADVRQLAHPGLVLRRLTPELILSVLAEPCGLKITTITEARRIFAELAREASLVKRDADGSLIHLPDLRKTILALLEADEPERAQQIHRAAVAYYESRPANQIERAEEIYHRLKLGQTRETCLARWLPGMENRLLNAVDEFENAQHAFLAAQLRLTVGDQVRQAAELPDWERLVGVRVHALVANRDFDAALELLAERTERLVDSELIEPEAEALVRTGRPSEARDVLMTAADRASEAGSFQIVYRRLLVLASVMVAAEHWDWSSPVIGRLQALVDATYDPAHRLALSAVSETVANSTLQPLNRTVPEFAEAFDAVDDKALATDDELRALAASLLRSRDQLDRLDRVIRINGIPSLDLNLHQALAARIAEFDRDAYSGSLATRLGLKTLPTGTETWSRALQGSIGSPPSLLLKELLGVYGAVMPDSVFAALADVLGSGLPQRHWATRNSSSIQPTTYIAPANASSSSSAVTDPLSRLADGLIASFSPDGFRIFLRRQFELSVDSLIDPDAAFEAVVRVAVSYLDKAGRSPELAARAREVAPADPDLLTAAAWMGVSTLSEPGSPAEEQVRKQSSLDLDMWRRRLGRIEGQICRVEWLSQQKGFGTGLLIGQDLVLTAAHIVGTEASALAVRFDYVEREGETVTGGTEFRVRDVQSFADHDFALLRIDGAPGITPVGGDLMSSATPRGWLELVSHFGRPPVGAGLVMAHHRSGGPLELAADAEAVLAYDDRAGQIFHTLARQPGSAGAPIFDANLDPVALQLGWVKEAPGTTEGAGFGVLLTTVRQTFDQDGLGDQVFSSLA